MWRTFFISPFAGGVAAVLGWIGAVLFRTSMSEVEFAALRFGWPGTMIGATALALMLVLLFASDLLEPLVTTVTAGFGVWMLWNQTELPFSTRNLETAETPYWFALSMGAGILFLLAMGLRAAREATPSRPRR